ncbi:MAG TPA: FtsX-like permease family protein [Rectinemataceae bacterium]|nr:FtsX-like permease family protein [Rectinemataceae bacterium]
MPVLIRIAFRNLLEHKAKSLIIGVLLALGVVILVVGNAFMDTAATGVKDTFIGNYTGDIFIAAKTKSPVSLFGVQSVGGQEATPNIPYFDKVAAHLSAERDVTGITSQVTGFALVSPKDSDKQSFALLFGIDPESYYKLFQNAYAIQGRLLRPGEEGLLISKHMAEQYAKDAGFTPKVGEDLILTGIGKAGFKIRSVPLVGIIGYKTESEATDFISYADVNTVRILSGLTLGNDPDEPVTPAQQQVLDASGDSLFGGETVIAASAVKAPAPAPTSSAKAAPHPVAQADTGAWHFLMARVRNPAEAPALILSLNQWFASQGIEAQAGGWKAAAGPFAASIDVVRVVFNIAIIIVAVVAIIIMMNTLVISVIERTGEIGTMRALGAQKGYVRTMFLAETLTIAAVFGVIGMVLAFGVIGILNLAHITASNPFLRILFAGDVLHPAVNPLSVVWSLVLVGFVAILAHLYPVSLALKVQPVRAMQTE